MNSTTGGDLGTFLRSRRTRVGPGEVGLVAGGLRRTPGLQREELALLAGISADYYTLLEEGEAGQPSGSVLDALARVLRLDDDERAQLFALAEQGPRTSEAAEQPDAVRRGVARIVASLPGPAWVFDHRLDVLAWNRPAEALLTRWSALPPRERNLLRFVLLDPAARDLYVAWERVAREFIGRLRTATTHWPDDPRVTELVDELTEASPEFRAWWPHYDVVEPGSGCSEYQHPVVGHLELDYETMRLSGQEEHYLVTVTAEPGTPSAERLRRL